jgi:SAM-dependent methyltransferase
MELDWSTLNRLRAGFLAGAAGHRDYWQSPADLAQYDATFAQRIGWKWDFVLNDLQRLGWQPPAGTVLDWGCGSGVASRALLDHFGSTTTRELWLSDRSALAVQFATRRAREKYPELSVQPGLPARVDLLVISHVLTELSPAGIEELLQLASQATAVLWVEPGTYEASRQLISIRERLRATQASGHKLSKDESSRPSPPPNGGEGARRVGEEAPVGSMPSATTGLGGFNIVAPCPHQERCGVLAPGCESHWCHQFATPPDFVFTDAFWTNFARTLGIDLRSLPLSYLVLDRRPATPLPANAARILGRPEVFKPHVELLGCLRDGLIAGTVSRREDADGYRRLKKGKCPSLQIWERTGNQLKSWRAWGDDSTA